MEKQGVLGQINVIESKKKALVGIRQDVENVIYNVITENYQDSSPLELKDIASMIPMLKECFPNEYLNAIKKALPKKNVLALKK